VASRVARELFGLEFPEAWPKDLPRTARPLTATVIASCAVLIVPQ
jgi:hypothetical protein